MNNKEIMTKHMKNLTPSQAVRVIYIIFAILFSLIPIFFTFGWLDIFINEKYWRFIYGFVGFSATLSFIIASIGFVILSVKELRNFAEKYKKLSTRIRHIKPIELFLAIILLPAFFFFYIYMLAVPVFKDISRDLAFYEGECRLEHRYSRGIDTYYLKFDLNNRESLIQISRYDYIALKGGYLSYKEYECNYDVEVTYTKNWNKAISFY